MIKVLKSSSQNYALDLLPQIVNLKKLETCVFAVHLHWYLRTGTNKFIPAQEIVSEENMMKNSCSSRQMLVVKWLINSSPFDHHSRN
jgi:hypothetical protein